MTARRSAEMVLVCSEAFDGISHTQTGAAEKLIQGNGFRGSSSRWVGRHERNGDRR
jgi:hypothetical protein